MAAFGKNLATVGIALIGAGAIAVAPTVQAPPRLVPTVQLAAATFPIVVQPPAPESNILGALFKFDLSKFIIPPSAGQPFPSPPKIPSPVDTGFEFEDAIINTYHAIEPWVQYGFELGAYAVGWIPWVGWLSPQIMIFYHFEERIVESLVVNSAEWLWGPLTFSQGLKNIAKDSWDALVQLGIDQWDFWLPLLPPLPFTTRQAQAQPRPAGTLTPTDQPLVPTMRPTPSRDVLAALRRLTDPHPVAPQTSGRQVNGDKDVNEPALTPLGNPERFGIKPKLAAEISNLSPLPSREPVVASNSPVETSNASIGTSNPPKNRFSGTNKHRLTGSPNGSTTSSLRSHSGG